MLAAWAVMLAAAILTGAAVCTSLVVRRRAMAPAVLAAAVLGAASIAAIVAVARSSGRVDSTIAASFIALGSFVGGFALAAALVPAITRLPPLPGPVLTATSEADPGIAFVLLADGQPEDYDPAVVTREYALLSETEAPVPPDAVRVFGYMSERMRYRSAGISPARPVVRAIAGRVAELLSHEGFAGPVAEAWLQGTPRLADTVAGLVGHGAREIVVVFLGVAESVPYDRARVETDMTVPPGSDARVCYAHTLWADDAIARLVAERTLAMLPKGPRATDGVVLAASGQPWQWDQESPRSCEHETFFLQRVRAALIVAGAPEANVRTAWLDWQDPGVTEVTRHLAALGCERVVVVPATTCADTLETVLDLPAAVDSADLDPGVRVEVLHGWGDSDAVAAAVTRAAVATARECRS